MSLHQHGSQTINFDMLAVGSGLEPVNSGLKITVGMISLITCLLSKGIVIPLFVAVIMIGITLHLGHIKGSAYWHFIWIPFTFILLSGITLLIDLSAVQQGYWDIRISNWYLSITEASIHTTLLVSIKALCSVNCLYMISLSTPLYEIIGVLRRCKIPEIIIELMYLMYRFIFILAETYHNMKISAQTRMGYVTIKHGYRSFFGICTNLLIVAFGKASKSFDAMEARGYDGSLLFLEKTKQITRKQLVITGIYCLILMIILILERTFK